MLFDDDNCASARFVCSRLAENRAKRFGKLELTMRSHVRHDVAEEVDATALQECRCPKDGRYSALEGFVSVA
jgi:hypothetical protein